MSAAEWIFGQCRTFVLACEVSGFDRGMVIDRAVDIARKTGRDSMSWRVLMAQRNKLMPARHFSTHPAPGDVVRYMASSGEHPLRVVVAVAAKSDNHDGAVLFRSVDTRNGWDDHLCPLSRWTAWCRGEARKDRRVERAKWLNRPRAWE